MDYTAAAICYGVSLALVAALVVVLSAELRRTNGLLNQLAEDVGVRKAESDRLRADMEMNHAFTDGRIDQVVDDVYRLKLSDSGMHFSVFSPDHSEGHDDHAWN